MPELFDAYHKWLAIPPSEQPPDHYRLLGLQQFEGDLEVISAGAVQRMNWVRKFQKGPHGIIAQKLVQEITSAWAELLNVQNKAKYDDQLKRRSAVSGLMTAASLNYPPDSLPNPVDFQDGPPIESAPEFLTDDGITVPPQTSRRKRRRRSSTFSLVMYFTSAALGLFLGYLVLRVLGVDLLHLPDESRKIVARASESFFTQSNKPSVNSNLNNNNQRSNKDVKVNPVLPTHDLRTRLPAEPSPINERKLSPPPRNIVTDLPETVIRDAKAAFQSQVNYAYRVVIELENSVPPTLTQTAKPLIDDWHNEVDRTRKNRSDAKNLIDQAIGVMAAGNKNAAMKAIERACEIDGTDNTAAEAEFLNGIQLGLIERNYKTAKYRFEGCLRHLPDDAASLNNLAIAEVMTDEHTSAINHFRAALASSGGNPAIVHNLVRVIGEANRKHLKVSPSIVAAYSALLEQTHIQPHQNSSGWLYLFPANDDQDDFDYQLLKQNDKLTVEGSYPPQWIEDRVCMVCEGRGHVQCPDCQNGTVGSTQRVFMYRDPNTGVEVSRDKKIRIPCNTCNGTGQVGCPNCNGSGIAPGIN